MYIIVGLGNPGKQYENTRHNLGFITVDRLADRHDIRITKIKHKALVGEGRISGQKVVLVKPQTFMNLSGNSVREVLEYYKEEPEHLIVVYDDIDIPAGTVRLRKKGSAGTHNGMRSIIYDIQSDQFPRLRVGIGGERKMPLDRYVLGGFTKEEKPLLEAAVDRGVGALETLLSKGIDIAMSECNVKSESGEKEKNEFSEH
ncbi:aminoacyl-tRNA hydrolase [Bacilliculturomica massiliensis]|uniref:aminoacyl-tRNA hydrolase n=1 Tax=Bacilliculturomica massiliensis TaxID=1917867 RepID=UPI00102FD103|nr:aminoacyl-tRNA hydrolase [Bacilliculturomica massiliensis]